jgi:cobalt/nickel transport protein
MQRICAALGALFCLSGTAFAHFGMIIPSTSTVTVTEQGQGEAAVSLDLKFWHPFANNGMNLEKPKNFQVFSDGKATDLLFALQPGTEQGNRTWRARHTIARPGVYAFFMEPQPYFEPEEDCYIIHYTKTYVDAFGYADGWDEPLGVRAEIVPLVNPNALYAGNVFHGRVLLDGKPAAGAEVEVEWYPGPDKKGVAPHDAMITQVVKTNDRGEFLYAPPVAGWWGFAALMEDDAPLDYKGEKKNVEIGAVLWIRLYDMQPAVPLQ